MARGINMVVSAANKFSITEEESYLFYQSADGRGDVCGFSRQRRIVIN